jgi:hypothetical protein
VKQSAFPLLAVLLLVAPALTGGSLLAQESTERGPDGGTRYHVDGIEVLPLPGKPFSGTDIIDWTRKLEDGSLVTTHLYAKVARSSEGRIYRERRSFVPAGSDEQPKLLAIILLDPAAHTRTTCTMATRNCEVSGYHPRSQFLALPVGPFAKGTRYLTRENLGTNTVEDLPVTGTRETITVNPGVIGNDRPLATTREFWYSADLQTNLSVTRNDPREGTQVIQLTELSRSEPDPSTFQVPAGFAVHDVRTSVRAEN